MESFPLRYSTISKCIELKPSEKTAYQRLWNLYQNQMEMESAESVIHKFGQIYPNEVDEVLGEHYEWSLNIYKEDIQKQLIMLTNMAYSCTNI